MYDDVPLSGHIQGRVHPDNTRINLIYYFAFALRYKYVKLYVWHIILMIRRNCLFFNFPCGYYWVACALQRVQRHVVEFKPL